MRTSPRLTKTKTHFSTSLRRNVFQQTFLFLCLFVCETETESHGVKHSAKKQSDRNSWTSWWFRVNVMDYFDLLKLISIPLKAPNGFSKEQKIRAQCLSLVQNVWKDGGQFSPLIDSWMRSLQTDCEGMRLNNHKMSLLFELYELNTVWILLKIMQTNDLSVHDQNRTIISEK